ncbi:hypothetical protein JCM11641_008133 [Rhodosporidiobolus odoratus]
MARLKRSPKRGGSANAHIAAFIARLQQVAQDELPSLIAPVLKQGWTWPRTDLQHWIHPLNRFDDILAKVIDDYDLGDMKHAQTNAFTPRTKQLVLSVLGFQKILLENSTNRKIFMGFDRLNDLLHTTDIEVLLATLRLALRPAQQFSSLNSSLSSVPFSEKRLLSLAQPWGTREHGLDMAHLAASAEIEIPLELQELEWQFYRKVEAGAAQPAGDDDKEKKEGKGKEVEMEVEPHPQAEAAASTSAAVPAATSTPGPSRRTSFAPHLQSTPATPATPAHPSTSAPAKPQEGLTTIHLPNMRTTQSSTIDLLLDVVSTHSVPEADRLDLLQKLRIGHALCAPSPAERQQLLVVRLLALSVFAHANSEAQAQQKLFLYEPELIPQIAELVHPEKDVPVEVRSAALYALEGFARYKGKTNEVAGALNASVSHGVLMEVVRKMVVDLEADEPESTPEYIDALFNLLTYINMHQTVGHMVIGAGLINILLDYVKNRKREQLVAANKAIILLDGFLYGYSAAFTAYIAAGGLAVFVERIKYEVDAAVEELSEKAKTAEPDIKENPTGLLSFAQGQVVKNIFRATQRLMTTSGTTEGLRNLIDTSLLTSCKTVMQNRLVFGPQIFSLSTNIAATFVHNEPTSLATLQEAKVPETFYDALEVSIPASNDVLQAIPNAIGAFCLNQAGLEAFSKRDLVSKYFAIFTSPSHAELLRDRDSALVIGSSIDELVRHHPSIKEKVLKSIMKVFEDIKVLGEKFEVKQGEEQTYGLTAAGAVSAATEGKGKEKEKEKEGDAMVVEERAAPAAPQAEDAQLQDQQQQESEKDKAQKKEEEQENEVTIAIDVFGRFLEGLYQNLGHVSDFLGEDRAFDVVLDLLELPYCPAIMQKNGGYSSIVAIFRIATEVNASDALSAILKRTDKYLAETTWFWEPKAEGVARESTLGGMINPSAEALAAQQARFRSLTILLSHIALLSDVFINLTYAHGKSATAIIKVFTTPEQTAILEKIGHVYRACTWENVTIRPTSFWTGDATKSATEQIEKEVPAQPVVPTPSAEARQEQQQEEAKEKAAVEVISTPATPDSPNIKLVQDVIQSFTKSMLPLFQSIIKLLVHRRSNDAYHRAIAKDVADKLAHFMRDNLEWPDAKDLPANLAYSAQSFILITKLAFDERPNMVGLQTHLLRSFIACGGLDAYLKLVSRLQEVATEYFASSDDITATSPMVIPVFGGIKTALELLSKLTSQKTLLEAPQTALLVTREKDAASPDYFDPHAFLVRLRAAVLPTVSAIWAQPWLRKSPQNVVRSLVATLINIIKGEGETSTEPASRNSAVDRLPPGPGAAAVNDIGGALNALGALLGGVGGAGALLGGAGAGPLGGAGAGPLGGAVGGAARAPPDEDRISQLIDMGFPRAAAIRALTRCRNDAGLAVEYLLMHPDIVGAARDDAGVPANDAAAPAQAGDNAAPAQDAQQAPAAADAPEEGADVADGEAAAAPAAEGGQEGQAPADVEMGEASQASGSGPAAEPEPQAEAQELPMVEEPQGPSLDEIKEELKTAREELKPAFMSHALTLAEDYSDLVFDIKGIYSLLTAAAGDEKTTPSLQPLLDELNSLGAGEEAKKNESASATRLRLLALLTTDAAYQKSVEPVRETIMASILRFQQLYAEQKPASDARPKWLASAMVVADSLLSIQTVPKPTTVLAEGDEVPSVELVAQGPAWDEERKAFFDLAVDVLEKGVSTREVFISTLRLLLVLTRDHKLATSLVDRGGLNALFSSIAKESSETKGCHSYVVMILRHVVEDETLLKPMMEREMETWFGNSRSKVADISGFLRNTSFASSRNMGVYLQAVKSTVKLVQADAPHHYHVTLLKDPSPASKKEESEPIKSPLNQGGAEAADTTMGDAAAAGKAIAKAISPASPTTEALVHFLMQQVLETSKAALAPAAPVDQSTGDKPAAADKPAAPAADSEGAETSTDEGKKDGKEGQIPADVPLGDFYQSAFSLACLAELAASYNPVKASILTFSTRKATSKEIAGAVAPKSRSSFLYFLLNDLVPSTGLTPASDFEAKRRTSMWGWASLVVVGLCYDATAASTLGSSNDKDSMQDVATVRKAVLDAVTRSYKDAMNSTEPTEIRYARLAALSDLCYRLLTARPFPHAGRPHSETSMQLAKLMLEKNFAVILTNALAEVDLNFPHVNTLINAILRPLENLTKVVTKLGRAKGSSGPPRKRLLDDASTDDTSMSEDEESGDDSQSEEEEVQDPAADLYRNSALGMYEGELERGHGDEYMSEDEEGFDEDDEMMEDMEEGFDGSDLSDASDDDDHHDFDEGDDLMDEGERDDLDTGSEGGELDENDVEEEIFLGEGDADEEEQDVLEAFEGEIDDGGEGDWVDEDEDDEDGGVRAGDELIFDGGVDAPIQAIEDEDDMDEDGEDDGFTDEEDVLTGELEFDPEMTEQLRAQSTAQAYGWDPVTGGDGSTARRNRGLADEMMELSDAGMFDRPRNTNTAAPHPLLVEAPSSEARPEAAPRRQRGANATSRDSPAYQEWVRSVEQMLGPGGVNTLQEVLGSHGLSHLSGPDQLRIQLAPGPDGGMAVVIDPSPGLRAAQAQASQDSAHRHTSSSNPNSARSVARQLSERLNAASAFLPMQTNQRWQEEGRILQGCVLVAERVARLVNHVVNALHAPAREEARVQKKKAEEQRKKDEEVERLEEEKRRKEEEEEEQEKKEEEKRQKEEEERKKREEEAAAERQRQEQEAANAAAASAMEVDNAEAEEMPQDVAEVVSLAQSLAAGLAVPSTSSSTPGDISRQPTPSTSSAQAGSSTAETTAGRVEDESMEAVAGDAGDGSPAERVTVLVFGEEVDITGMGIDREFLEALPDDMREDVIAQHVHETSRSAQRPAAPVPAAINSEFLDALPSNVRADVVRQEAATQRRQQPSASGPASASGSGSGSGSRAEGQPAAAAGQVDLDPGSFLSTLDPALRSAVLGDRDGASGIGSDQNGIAGRSPLTARRTGGLPGASATEDPAGTAKKATPSREVIQLLDKSGLATLIRLLFFPHPLRRNSLQKVLVNLCENNRTRVELINLLLTILHDGTRDVSAVDKSFSQMSLRASKALGAKDTPKRKIPETPGGALPHFAGESVPNLIAQRCLEALLFLASANEQTPLFFLAEQEISVTKRSSKKGKGKEKAVPPSMTYPITVLLGLFERPALLKAPVLMDALTTLLATITRSLTVLQKKVKPDDKAASSTSAPAASSASADAPASSTDPSATDGERTEGNKDKAEKSKEPLMDPEGLVDSPPQIGPASLRLVVNVLDAGECSSKTFSQTLGLLQHLSYLSDARTTILDELKARAEKIAEQLMPDLASLLEAINSDEPVRGTVLSQFTPASSGQAKLLRILKTIDFFGGAVKKGIVPPTAGEPASKSLTEEEQQVKAIYNSLSFSDLWKRLGDALGVIETKPDLLYLSTVLLPLIESLLVVNKFTDSSSTDFLDFTTAHSKILNTMVRNNPSLMSGSFAVLVRNSTMLDFENKRSFFFSRLNERQTRQRMTINLNVRRAHVFEDSFHVFLHRSGEDIKHGKLNVKFYGEEGVDAGGVTREWFSVLARQMFNPGYALFQPQAADSLVYQPNKSSGINEDHLRYFRFIGRVIGKAVHDQRILEAYFSRAVYKHMLGKPVDHKDLESIDPEYYKSLVWMLDNDIEGIIDLTFSIERDEFGVVEIVDLIPNGRNIVVTNENKHDYVRRIADQRLHADIKVQMDAMLRGLYEIVPKDILQIFSERELELLISGLPEVEVDEWRAHTDLVGYSATDPIIGYFWRAVRSFSHEERAKLLQFVTGSSRVPLEGFGSLQGMSGTTRFNIHKAGGTNTLPTAHTCFNQLDLPNYDSYETFVKMLRLAFTEGLTGFAFQ